MIPFTLNGTPVWLVDHLPHWDTPVSLRMEVPSSQERGLTGREFRRNLGATLRTRLRWDSVLKADDLASFLAGLKALKQSPLIAPVWPLAVPADQMPPRVDGLLVAWRGGGVSPLEWGLDTAIGDPGNWEWIAPAIHGFFDKVPEPDSIHPELARVEFSVLEDGPAQYALDPPSYVWPVGPALPDTVATLVFPWAVNWSRPVHAGGAVYEIDRQEIGPGRERARVYYEQNAERPVAGRLTLPDADSIAKFIAWWLRQGGDASAHWAPAQIQPVRLAADAAMGATTLSITPASNWGPDTYAIGLSRSYGPEPEYARILSVAGGTVNLSAPLAIAWDKEETVLVPLVLARHRSPSIELDFITASTAQAEVQWREVGAEGILAEGEDRGETIGRGPERAWLYTITTTRGGGASESQYFTSYERPVTLSGTIHEARVADHTEIRQSVILDREEITLNLRWWEDCPLELFMPGELVARMRLEVRVGDVNTLGVVDPSTVRTIFCGDITSAQFDGPLLSATAAGASALFDRQVPALVMQRVCNWTVYESGCRLLRTDWTFTAIVVSVAGTTLTLNTFAHPGGLPPGFGTFADWFALGTLADATGENVFILRSTAIAGGQMTLEVDREFDTTPLAGAVMTLVPGCDGRDVTCRPHTSDPGVSQADWKNPEGKFNNFVNFGGFPQLPDTVPTLQPSPIPNTGSGKK